MTTDLPTIVAELRALFIVALMKGGATREDAERKATPDVSYERTKVECGDKQGVTCCWYTRPLPSLNVDRPLYEKHARAILEAHYEKLWCGIGDHKYAATVTRHRNGYNVSGNHAGSHTADDKLSAILAAMLAHIPPTTSYPPSSQPCVRFTVRPANEA